MLRPPYKQALTGVTIVAKVNRMNKQRRSDLDTADTNFREMFTEMPHEELVEVALRLSADAARLRRELDEANGVIR